MENDRVLVATTEKDVPVMTMLFGEHENETGTAMKLTGMPSIAVWCLGI